MSFIMSEYNIPSDQNKRKPAKTSRADKLKEIDALYQVQMKQIYPESKDKLEKQSVEPKRSFNDIDRHQSIASNDAPPSYKPTYPEKQLQNSKSASNIKLPQNNSASRFLLLGLSNDQKIRASTLLKGQSTRTIQILRRQNENKELKIRELGNRCENLIQKLKKYMGAQQFQAEIEKIKDFADGKTQRLENLFKIKHQEIFFKLKLQVIALLQEFSIPKEELAELNDIATQTSLFTYMAKKIKSRLKDFRSKEQQSNFEIQKDRILNQNQQQRIHFLTETTELLKLSQSKLKAKVEDLKNQLNQYLEKLKLREQQNQQTENQVFRLKKQNEQLHSVNQKLTSSTRNVNGDRIEDRRVWEAKEKQMKTLLNNYFVEKQKLEKELEEKDGEIQQMLIKQRFLQQENERLNRELVRWKERYQWLQREKDSKLKELEQERNNIEADFQDYKLQHNQGNQLTYRNQIGQAFRKIEEYQRAYEGLQLRIQEQRRLLQASEEKNQQKLQKMEREWLQRVKRLQRIKEEQIFQMGQQTQSKINEMRQQFSKKQQLLSQEMQARMRALLAQKDKKMTEQLIQLQAQNDQLRRQIDDLNKIIEVKESLINVINNKKLGS